MCWAYVLLPQLFSAPAKRYILFALNFLWLLIIYGALFSNYMCTIFQTEQNIIDNMCTEETVNSIQGVPEETPSPPPPFNCKKRRKFNKFPLRTFI